MTAADEHCPWCEQPIPHGNFEEIIRRLQAREREQYESMQLRLTAEFAQKTAALEAKAQATVAEAAAVAEQRVQAARNEARQVAEAAAQARVSEIEARALRSPSRRELPQQEQMAALQEGQEDALNARVTEVLETVQREREAAVLAEKAKVLKLQSELQDMQRKLEGKSAHELGEGSEVDLFEQLRTTFEGDRIQRVPKGVNGADVIHEVDAQRQGVRQIIYDAKNETPGRTCSPAAER